MNIYEARDLAAWCRRMSSLPPALARAKERAHLAAATPAERDAALAGWRRAVEQQHRIRYDGPRF